MSVTLRSSTGVIEVHWWFEAARDGRSRLPFQDRQYARAFLGRIGEGAGNLAVLRRFAADRLSTPSIRVEDTALLDELAWWVVSGRVRVAAHLPELRGMATAAEEAPAPQIAWDAPVPTEEAAPVVEPPTFPTDIDAPAIAAAMREAAREGVPFCEQCMRKRLAAKRATEAPTLSAGVDAPAMAATLKRAAERGTPFCEECEKAKAARAAGGNET